MENTFKFRDGLTISLSQPEPKIVVVLRINHIYTYSHEDILQQDAVGQGIADCPDDAQRTDQARGDQGGCFGREGQPTV